MPARIAKKPVAAKPGLRLGKEHADSERARKAIAAKPAGRIDLFAGFLNAAGVKGHHLRQISPKAFQKAMARPKMRPKSKAVKRSPMRRVL